jgi:DNA invertase Pin-like site-specific DNA recombinase
MIVALYARVSTVKQAEKDLSIPDQLQQMRAWCAARGHAVAAEYQEPGASALDDRRPEFQRMIVEACRVPQAFDAVCVHSQSRFFRDVEGFLSYERRLKRAGVKLISITQPVEEDAGDKMIRQVFSAFDQYQSGENSKHTSRAMNENARRGFFNGSRPLFGYTTVAVAAPGNKGQKRRHAIDEAEAAIVRRVFDLYVHGENGVPLGFYGVARALNRDGYTCRGRAWSKKRVEQVLRDRSYMGEHYFNRKEGKTGRRKPQAEWVLCPVPPILSEQTFAAAQMRREMRQPAKIAPRVVSSPTLLTGLLKCGRCGGSMVLRTGKGGRYRYYACAVRVHNGGRCESGSVPMSALDAAVLRGFTERVLRPERVEEILRAVADRHRTTQSRSAEQLRTLRQQLEETRAASNRLYEAVERGFLSLDSTLRERAHAIETRREALLAEIAGIQRLEEIPTQVLTARKLEAFCRAMRRRVMDVASGFGKAYLRLFVEEVRLTGRVVLMRGREDVLVQAVAQKDLGTSGAVPSLGYAWLPSEDSKGGLLADRVTMSTGDRGPSGLRTGESGGHSTDTLQRPSPAGDSERRRRWAW